MMQQKKWYDNHALIILLIVLFFPVGIYGLWKSNYKKSVKWALSLIIALIVIAAISSDESSVRGSGKVIETEKKVEEKKWNQYTYEEKQKWIEDYLKEPDDAGYQLIAMMHNSVKGQFNYPKEVDFDFGKAPVFSNAYVVEADSGWVIVSGTGTGKNAFGVKQGFSYQCKLKIDPETRSLENVSVSEHR